VQFCLQFAGTGIAKAEIVTNFFMAGSDRVSWEIVTVASDGPYKLSIVHPRGTIVEYFTTSAEAVKREQELEALFLASPAARAVAACAS
jgi:hypothetical protein